VLLVFGHPRDGEVVTAQELVENLLARVHLDASVSFDSTHEGSGRRARKRAGISGAAIDGGETHAPTRPATR
jgi:hypothetical protein